MNCPPKVEHRCNLPGGQIQPRLIGWGAEQWLKRFDVPEEELLAYKAPLLNKPKLTKATTLPNRL